MSSKSSLLAVDVLFPVPLGRDPSLVQAFFVKGPVHEGLGELADPIPSTFVKGSRAYLLDPEPGTYSLVAVSSAFAPPSNEYPIAGVTMTRWSGTSSDATIFPAKLIERTSTTVAPGRVAFMGVLRVRQGDRLDANAALQDDLQRRLAERIRPGVTSESGLAGWLKRTRMVDLEKTSLRDDPVDRAAFFDAAQEDLGDSPWVRIVARAAERETADAMASAPAPRARRKARPPEPVVAKPPSPGPRIATQEPEAATALQEASSQPATPAPQPPRPAAVDPPEPAAVEPIEPTAVGPIEPTAVEPTVAARKPETVPRQPEAPPEVPKRPQGTTPPSGSPLAGIAIGMSFREVRAILGPPDERLDRTTAKAFIPFYSGPGAYLRDWIYEGKGRVVFSLHDGSLEVLDVVHDPPEAK